MRAMVQDSLWLAEPPALSPALVACLTETGSLTERLMATGRAFAVTVLRQGLAGGHDDESAQLGLPKGAPQYVREVALTLDGVPVVFARSYCRPDCPVWLPVLDRGSRSLGLTLFGGLPQLCREPLHYALLPASHPLCASANLIIPAQTPPARRCRFLLDQAPMVVCEVFLPTLENLLS